MIKEETWKPKDLTPLQGVLWIAGTVAAMLVWLLFIRLLIAWTGIGWLDGVFFLGIAFLIAWLLKERALACRYVLVEDALFLERSYGKRSQLMVHIPLAHIIEMGPQNTQRSLSRVRPRPLRFIRGREAGFCIRYREGKAERAAIFLPSVEFVAAIETARVGHPPA